MFDKKFLFDQCLAMPECYEAKFQRRGIGYQIRIGAEKLAFNMADVSIAPNESYRQIALTRGHMQPGRAFIVRNGPGLEQFHIRPPTPALRMGNKYLVGCLCAGERQDRLPHLIEAVRHIVYDLKRADIHFTLIGGGPSLENYKNLAVEKQLGDDIEFAGPASEQIMLDILNTADICVSTDAANPANDQSSANPIVDYMALGKPIVQYELVEGHFSAGGASLYAAANDTADFAAKIIALIDNPQQRASMSALGRARVERSLAWRYEAPRLLAAYDAIFAEAADRKHTLISFFNPVHTFGSVTLWYKKRP